MVARRPLPEKAECIDCQAEFSPSKTKTSPRCEACRTDIDNIQRSGRSKIAKAERDAEKKLTGPKVEHKCSDRHCSIPDGLELAHQRPVFPKHLTAAIEEQDAEDAYYANLMSDDSSSGSHWIYVPDEGFGVEDNKGAVVYDSESGLRRTASTVRSPRLPAGTDEGCTTTREDLQSFLNGLYRDANDHPWFDSHVFWNYSSRAEIAGEYEDTVKDIKSAVQAALQRDAVRKAEKSAKAGKKAREKRDGK